LTLPITSFELVVVLEPVEDVPDIEPVSDVDPVPIEPVPDVEPVPEVEGSLEPVVPEVVPDDVLPCPDCVLVLLFSSSLVDVLEPPVV
jgi:hypothetical protein